jgi:N-dimethylarginine dimethylaminohydrolase
MNIHATLGDPAQPRFLVCPPRHFAVTYSINPWMNPNAWAEQGAALHDIAQAQWAGLKRSLGEAGAALDILDAEADLPDLVFTANAAVVCDGKVLLARFHHDERQREEPVFARAFAALKARGLLTEVATLPEGITLEGAGDCILDVSRRVFWMGCGFRSDATAAAAVEDAFGLRAISLPLADPRFYHLDTALCALPCGGVLYYPKAFTEAALAAIHQEVAPRDRIALGAADAARFAANAVCVDRTIILSRCSAELWRILADRGYTVVETPLDVFQRSGGSACCMTLRLDHRSRTIGERVQAPAAGAGDVVFKEAVRRA